MQYFGQSECRNKATIQLRLKGQPRSDRAAHVCTGYDLFVLRYELNAESSVLRA